MAARDIGARAGYLRAMSDISFRFDGLLLAAAMILTGGIFLLGALGAWMVATARPDAPRAGRAARRAALLLAVNAAGLLLVLWYMDQPHPDLSNDDPDWIDWLTLPWLLFFLAGGAWALWRPRTKAETDAARP